MPALPPVHCRVEADAACKQRDDLQARLVVLQEQLREQQVGRWVPERGFHECPGSAGNTVAKLATRLPDEGPVLVVSCRHKLTSC